MPQIENSKVAVLATHGFEKSELFAPVERLREEGADVTILSIGDDHIKSWDQDNWGESVAVDKHVKDAKVQDYDALVLPGGQINPDILRTNADAVRFVLNFFNSGKTLAAICHAPWLLIEAGVIKDRNVTSYQSIRTDVENAGGKWEDSAVVVDEALVTSRNPGDLDAFCSKIVEEIREGRHEREPA